MDQPAQNNTKTQALISVLIGGPGGSQKSSDLRKAGLVLLLIFLALGVLGLYIVSIKYISKSPRLALSPKSASENEEATNTNGNYSISGSVVEIDTKNKILNIKSTKDGTIYSIKITNKTTFIGKPPGLPVKVINNEFVYPTGVIVVNAAPIDFKSVNLESWITVEIDAHSDSKFPEAIVVSQGI